ncbi:NAD(P)H-dependent oxidoreductase [Gibbsiella dentisursi]|uniref:NAD(P)H-dependent oxidoreductase n=1 Tax=Gibbsiella dentisursi TaxID=796890 RepID=A0ABP7KT09_9GAMM
MNVLIVTAHPEPSSFNAHLAAKASEVFYKEGCHVEMINLYEENFDPFERKIHYQDRKNVKKFDPMQEQRHHWKAAKLPSEIKRHVELLKNTDVLILHFPFWWFGMPAVLKGWMDRVFVYGGLYDSTHRHENGVMKGKRALLTVTAGSSANACGHNGRDGNMQLMLWPPMQALQYIGFTILEPYLIYGVRGGLEDHDQMEQDLRLKKEVLNFENRLINLQAWPEVIFNKNDDFREDMTLKPTATEYSPFVRHCPDAWQANR